MSYLALSLGPPVLLAAMTSIAACWCGFYCLGATRDPHRASPLWRLFCGVIIGLGLWGGHLQMLLAMTGGLVRPSIEPIFLSALVCVGGMGAALASYRPAMIAREHLGAGALAGASLTSGLCLCGAGFGAHPRLDLASASMLLASFLFASALAIASFDLFASPSRWRVATSGALLAAACLVVEIFDAISPGLNRWTPAIDAYGAQGGVLSTAIAAAFGGLLIGGASIGLARRRAEASRDAVAEAAAAMAQQDIVTGLLNRSGLDERLTDWVSRGDRFAIAAIELEGLSALNMLAGHAAGDDAVVQAASLIFDDAGQEGIVARLDAGEFVLALPATTSEAFMRRLRDLRMKLDCSIVAAGRPFNPNVAVGMALYPHDGSDGEELVRRAYTALQNAKGAPPERLSFFAAGMEIGLVERDGVEHDLALAISEDCVEPYFQPIVRFSDGHIVGYEILARWPHPRRGLISPAVFIPLAERAGLLAPLTLNLLRRACPRALHWPGAPRLAINLSPGLLSEPAMAFCILNVLKACDFPSERLEIEITETDLIADFEPARANLATLRSRGVRVALDDFGVGHSSLTRLSELPVDIIKIDQSFVTAIADRDEARAIVAAIVNLAASLDLIVTAEGVESEALARALRSLGCEQGQGYWLGPPHQHLLAVPINFVAPSSERWLGADAAGSFAAGAPPRALRH